MSLVTPHLLISYSSFRNQSVYTGSLPVDTDSSNTYYTDVGSHTVLDDRFGRSVTSPQISYIEPGVNVGFASWSMDAQQIVSESFDLTPLGLTLPLSSRFTTAYDQFTNVKSQITHLLMTRLGEGVGMDAEFGTNLYAIVFEQMDDVNFENNIRNEIQRVVTMGVQRQWIKPAVQVTSIAVKKDKDTHTTYIQVLFTAATPIGAAGTAKLGTQGSIVLAF